MSTLNSTNEILIEMMFLMWNVNFPLSLCTHSSSSVVTFKEYYYLFGVPNENEWRGTALWTHGKRDQSGGESAWEIGTFQGLYL